MKVPETCPKSSYGAISLGQTEGKCEGASFNSITLSPEPVCKKCPSFVPSKKINPL